MGEICIDTSYLKGKSAAVVGIGISNRPLINFLLSHGVTVTARDMKSREKLEPFASALEEKNVKLICGENYLDNIADDLVFRTPGVRYDKPGLLKAAANGSVITSEMELFFSLTPATIIGITGSDGKTTTTTITAKILETSGKRVHIGGNIGKPLLPDVEQMTAEDIAVVELSSFQLQTMKQSPHIAVVTNVSPNHLDYHLDMGEYTAAKENIFLHEHNRRLILNYKNAVTRAMAEKARKGAEVVFFQSEDKNGIYEENGIIYYRDDPVIACSDIFLPGHHNVENYMAAIGAVRAFASNEDILSVANTFGGVEHRGELVRVHNGIRYYNSSIDSSPTRTEAALNSFTQKVIVICGGSDKHIPFEGLARCLCERAKTVVLTGASAAKIKAALESCDCSPRPEIIENPDFTEAVKAASNAAVSGDVVILSPACASFDAFPNFEVRGNKFKEIIKNL